MFIGKSTSSAIRCAPSLARRESDLRHVDWNTVGRRFAADSQSLTLNWPNPKTRAFVAVNHLCTAHANSGYIVPGHLRFDPKADMEETEASMTINGDLIKDRCWRQHGRLWTACEFRKYLSDIPQQGDIHPDVLPDMHLGLQLPHDGALVRQDIQKYAHALIFRRMVSTSHCRFCFIQDGDSGLSKAFLAAFAAELRGGRVDVATITFDKYQTNDHRAAPKVKSMSVISLDNEQLAARKSQQSSGCFCKRPADRVQDSARKQWRKIVNFGGYMRKWTCYLHGCVDIFTANINSGNVIAALTFCQDEYEGVSVKEIKINKIEFSPVIASFISTRNGDPSYSQIRSMPVDAELDAELDAASIVSSSAKAAIAVPGNLICAMHVAAATAILS